VELDCALLAAVAAGEISTDRFQSYQRIIETIEAMADLNPRQKK